MLVMNEGKKYKVMNGNSKCNIKDAITNQYMIDDDGTIWLCIFYNNLQKGANTFKGYTGNQARNTHLFVNNTCWCNTLLLKDCDHGDNYEFLVTQQETTAMDTTKRYRWIQDVNPYNASYVLTTHDKITPIENIGDGYGGMYLGGDNNARYFNMGDGGWWYGFGYFGSGWSNGVPGYDRATCYGLQAVYIRVYSMSK
jgi:hypothetical protein